MPRRQMPRRQMPHRQMPHLLPHPLPPRRMVPAAPRAVSAAEPQDAQDAPARAGAEVADVALRLRRPHR